MASTPASSENSRKFSERRPPQPVLDDVEWGLRRGLTPDQIAAELNGAPTGRTIRNWITKEWVKRPVRPSEPWSVIRGSADDAALVLPVLQLLARWPREARWLSVEEADAIARVRKASPTMPAGIALSLAVVYLQRGRSDTTDLDLYIAFHPWHGADEPEPERRQRIERYQAVARDAGIPAIRVSDLHPGQIYSMETGLPLWAEEV